ncbi:MAG: tRNA dihydrouridine synthase DusB [Planctomycetaceae bacterium]|jgi:tRNA-dihydrouridine synthase B|nr:tRNA dihydrouridine synthase DusB [Planctomycetaceae bacterium]
MTPIASSFHIGSLLIDPPLLSAPMAGFTNLAYREILRRFGGVGLIATEMISARSFIYKEAHGEDAPSRLWGIADEPRPLSVQIWDNQPETLAYFAETLTRDYQPSVIDLNFGCPAPAIAKNSASGSYLLKTPEKVGAIVERVVRAAGKIPVTAKIRLGWTRGTINAIDAAQAIESAGGAALTVHGRTAQEMYSGKADWDAIAAIKPHLKRIPLIGNGDIKSAEQAAEIFRKFPVDGVMIGRAGLEKPWIFRQISQLLRGEELPTEPPLAKQRDLLLRHFDLLASQTGVEKAVILMRKYAACYSKGKRGARQFRTAVCTARNETEFRKIVQELFPIET